MIAKHVMNIHMNRPNVNGDEDGNAVGEIDLDKMKAYIAYCKRYAFGSCFSFLVILKSIV
jgi:DNA replicative helicase MCM subunit Mcm2 (Cdc46/Mcm family)